MDCSTRIPVGSLCRGTYTDYADIRLNDEFGGSECASISIQGVAAGKSRVLRKPSTYRAPQHIDKQASS